MTTVLLAYEYFCVIILPMRRKTISGHREVME